MKNNKLTFLMILSMLTQTMYGQLDHSIFIKLKESVNRIDTRLVGGDSLKSIIDGESTEGGELSGYFDAYENLLKMKVELFGEMGRWVENYYLTKNGEVFYMTLETFKYNRSPLEEESKVPFKEKKTEYFVIGFPEGKLNYALKQNGKRKFEGQKNEYEEQIYWKGRCERLKLDALNQYRENFQATWKDAQFETTKINAVFCVKGDKYLLAFVNLVGDHSGHANEVLSNQKFGVLQLEYNSLRSEWVIRKKEILFQHYESLDVDPNYKFVVQNEKTKLLFTYTVTNDSKKEKHVRTLDMEDLSSDVVKTILK